MLFQTAVINTCDYVKSPADHIALANLHRDSIQTWLVENDPFRIESITLGHSIEPTDIVVHSVEITRACCRHFFISLIVYTETGPAI